MVIEQTREVLGVECMKRLAVEVWEQSCDRKPGQRERAHPPRVPKVVPAKASLELRPRATAAPRTLLQLMTIMEDARIMRRSCFCFVWDLRWNVAAGMVQVTWASCNSKVEFKAAHRSKRGVENAKADIIRKRHDDTTRKTHTLY